jgi:hypothetical protein
MEYLINGDFVGPKEWAIKLAQALKKTDYIKQGFNDLLYENYGAIEVEGKKYTPDMFLEKIDQKHYDKLFTDYCEKESFTIVEWNDEYDNYIAGDYFIAKEK